MSAQPTSVPDAPSALTPSELVALFPTHFAPRGGKPAQSAPDVTHLPAAPRVPASKEADYPTLAARIAAVALLADEQAGSLTLRAESQKRLFGLRTVQVVTATAADETPPFPEGTWERRLHAALLKQKDRSASVRDLIFRYVPTSRDPFAWVIDVALGALQQRGLMDVTEERKLKVITLRHWSLPETTAQRARQASPGAAEQLLSEAQRDRPELVTMLLEQVKRGIRQNEEQSNAGGAGDF